MEEYATDRLAALVPLPAADANKYSRGKLTLVAGSARFPGAACLAAMAGQRMGAGYTEVLTHPDAVAAVRACSPSLVVRSHGEGIPDSAGCAGADAGDAGADASGTGAANASAGAGGSAVGDAGALAAASALRFAPWRPGRPCAYVVGCGFDAAAPETARLVCAVLAGAQAPVLVDGGGLAELSSGECRALLRSRFEGGQVTVITPHAGEAARLALPLGLPTDDPARLSRSLSLAYGVVTLLKGPISYVSDGERTVRMAEGSPALAKAGTGDVLAGMAGALLAQGMDALDACVLAASLHARAGRIAAGRLTPVCVLAEDVAEALPAAVGELLASTVSQPRRNDGATSGR